MSRNKLSWVDLCMSLMAYCGSACEFLLLIAASSDEEEEEEEEEEEGRG